MVICDNTDGDWAFEVLLWAKTVVKGFHRCRMLTASCLVVYLTGIVVTTFEEITLSFGLIYCKWCYFMGFVVEERWWLLNIYVLLLSKNDILYMTFSCLCFYLQAFRQVSESVWTSVSLHFVRSLLCSNTWEGVRTVLAERELREILEYLGFYCFHMHTAYFCCSFPIKCVF